MTCEEGAIPLLFIKRSGELNRSSSILRDGQNMEAEPKELTRVLKEWAMKYIYDNIKNTNANLRGKEDRAKTGIHE
jgi:hypothetical protein